MKSEQHPVLVVEDDPFLRKIMLNRLLEEGILAESAEDGEEALNMMKARKFKAILLDLLMPIKSGFEVLKNLQDHDNKVPVLVFTNLAQVEAEKAVESFGVQDFFVKSDISTDEFIDRVKEHL